MMETAPIEYLTLIAILILKYFPTDCDVKQNMICLSTDLSVAKFESR